MSKTVKAISKKTVVAPVREFIAGELAFHDAWDDGRGNSTTTTRLVRIQFLAARPDFGGTDAVVVLENGSLAIVGVSNLRHLPNVFTGATI